MITRRGFLKAAAIAVPCAFCGGFAAKAHHCVSCGAPTPVAEQASVVVDGRKAPHMERTPIEVTTHGDDTERFVLGAARYYDGDGTQVTRSEYLRLVDEYLRVRG